MSLRTKILALLHQEGASSEEDQNSGAASQTGAALPDSGVNAELQAQLDAAKANEREARAQLATARESGFKLAAETFANAMLASNQLTPAQREPLVAALVQAAKDDAVSPLASGSRVASIQASYQAAPKHNLTAELVQSGTVLPTQAAGARSEEDLAIDRVLGMAVRKADAPASNGRVR